MQLHLPHKWTGMYPSKSFYKTNSHFYSAQRGVKYLALVSCLQHGALICPEPQPPCFSLLTILFARLDQYLHIIASFYSPIFSQLSSLPSPLISYPGIFPAHFPQVRCLCSCIPIPSSISHLSSSPHHVPKKSLYILSFKFIFLSFFRV